MNTYQRNVKSDVFRRRRRKLREELTERANRVVFHDHDHVRCSSRKILKHNRGRGRPFNKAAMQEAWARGE